MGELDLTLPNLFEIDEPKVIEKRALEVWFYEDGQDKMEKGQAHRSNKQMETGGNNFELDLEQCPVSKRVKLEKTDPEYGYLHVCFHCKNNGDVGPD